MISKMVKEILRSSDNTSVVEKEISGPTSVCKNPTASNTIRTQSTYFIELIVLH